MAKIRSIRKPSRRVIFCLFLASKQSSSDEKISMTRSMVSKFFGVIGPAKTTGNAKTMQILKMLLPTMLPTRRSDSPFLAAVMVVTSSGSDVPIAMTVREMIRSEMPIALAINDDELTTS